MTKKQFQFWLKEIDRELVYIGGKKFIYREKSPDSQAPQLWGYKFNTKYGEYICHVEIPWHVDPEDRRRLRYDMTVYGRFAKGNNEKVKNPSGKWNFYYSDNYGDDGSNVLMTVGAISYQIGQILVDKLNENDNLKPWRQEQT